MAELPVVSPVVEAIEAAVEKAAWVGGGWNLSLGQIGEPCERKLWYGLRWAHERETFRGAKLRLFEAGHAEEARMIKWLRMAGVIVTDKNPETHKQWEVKFIGGHMRGKLDGRAIGVPGAEKTEHVLECKTHNDKSFKGLLKDGVEKSKPEHWMQMQAYMHGFGISRSLYIAMNKNDSTLYSERVEYNAAAAIALIAKGGRIVFSDRPPTKLHEDPEHKMAWACRSCPALSVCHQGAFARTNCRTCLHSTAKEDGSWHCARFDKTLTIEDQQVGCVKHLFLPDLVPGEQVDADPEAETVTYMVRGKQWVDGGRVAS